MRRTKRDFGAASPRFKRPAPNRSRINLTARTLDRLFYAWRFGLLDELHLEKLLGNYGRQTHRELELTRGGLIYHPEAQVPLRAVCNDISWITALTNFGADTLAAKGYRIDPTRHRERYRRHKSYNSILHDLNRTDFLVDMITAVENVSKNVQRPSAKEADRKQTTTMPEEGSAITLQHQDEIFGVPYTETLSFPSMAVWKKEHRPLTVEPDGLFSLILPNSDDNRARKFFALEVDQDTESNMRYRNFWEQKSVIKTMIAYGEAHRRGIVEDRLGLSNLRTIFVTTTERHITNILRDAQTHYVAAGYPANAVLFISREALDSTDPLQATYKNAAGRDVSLVAAIDE